MPVVPWRVHIRYFRWLSNTCGNPITVSGRQDFISVCICGWSYCRAKLCTSAAQPFLLTFTPLTTTLGDPYSVYEWKIRSRTLVVYKIPFNSLTKLTKIHFKYHILNTLYHSSQRHQLYCLLSRCYSPMFYLCSLLGCRLSRNKCHSGSVKFGRCRT